MWHYETDLKTDTDIGSDIPESPVNVLIFSHAVEITILLIHVFKSFNYTPLQFLDSFHTSHWSIISGPLLSDELHARYISLLV